MSDEWGVGNNTEEKAFAMAKVGSKLVELILGEHPHSRSDNNIYARWPSGRIDGFDGHRIIVKVEIEEENYLKQSELSGDEIRRGGVGKISFNGVQIYEFFHRDAEEALIRARGLVQKLKDSEARLWEPDKLIGRKIYYRETPAVIDSVILEQGCVMIRTEDGQKFPEPCWRKGEDFGPEPESRIKEDVLSPHIWWFRD
jgi:hypothetical protein